MKKKGWGKDKEERKRVNKKRKKEKRKKNGNAGMKRVGGVRGFGPWGGKQ